MKKKKAATPKRPPSRHQLKASAYHLKPAEVKKLIIAASNFRNRCVIKTLYWLGLRRHELIALDIRDIDVTRKRIEVRSGKGGKNLGGFALSGSPFSFLLQGLPGPGLDAGGLIVEAVLLRNDIGDAAELLSEALIDLGRSGIH